MYRIQKKNTQKMLLKKKKGTEHFLQRQENARMAKNDGQKKKGIFERMTLLALSETKAEGRLEQRTFGGKRAETFRRHNVRPFFSCIGAMKMSSKDIVLRNIWEKRLLQRQ